VARILEFIWHETDVTATRTIAENEVINKVTVKTSDRVTWTELQFMRPVPAWNDSHPNEPGFYLDYINPIHKSQFIWELECFYTPFPGGQQDPSPTARPAEIDYSTSLVEQAVLQDINKRPIVTTAGEFITGVVQQIPIVEYSIVKNLAADPAWLQTHLGAVNADPITLRGLTWKPKTVLLASASGGAFITEHRTRYTPTTIKLMADARGWTQEVWNRGTVELRLVEREIRNGDDKPIIKRIWQQVPIETGDPPEPVSDPVPLDIYGQAILDFLQQDRTRPIRPSALISLNFETQLALPFRGVLPLT
jgi:hypothetical protein